MKEIEDKNSEIIADTSNKVSFEIKTFASLVIPIYFSQLAAHATGVISALMTGSYNTLDQAAVATGNMLFWPVFFGLGGSLFIVTAFVAQFYGAKRNAEIGPLLKQAFWLCIPLIILVTIYLSYIGQILDFFGTPKEVQKITKGYLYGLMIGTPALFLFQPLKSFSEGITRPLPVTVINIGMVTLSAILNYGLIFGIFGVPEVGGAGCGISFAISSWSALLALGSYIYCSKPYHSATMKHWRRVIRGKFAGLFGAGAQSAAYWGGADNLTSSILFSLMRFSILLKFNSVVILHDPLEIVSFRIILIDVK